MTRRTKWRSREKWICGNGRKNDVYVDDALIFAEFGKIFTAIKNDSSLLDNRNSGKSSSYSFEEIQCRNELRKIMDSPEPDFNKGKNLIFKLAKLKFLWNCPYAFSRRGEMLDFCVFVLFLRQDIRFEKGFRVIYVENIGDFIVFFK